MNMNRPDHLYQAENIDQNFIKQLANEIYMEDLAPEFIAQMAGDKAPAHSVYRPKLQRHDPVKMLEETANNAVNSMNIRESDYYFLPHFSSASTAKPQCILNTQKLDILSIRKDFPILQRRINGRPLVWLDNGATTQKPNQVIHSLNQYYSEYNSNVHRGAHTLAKLATNAYEAAREKVRNFIGAGSTDEIIFLRGTTEAINLVAESFGGMNIHTGDEILLTTMEHHSNIVPWQKLQQITGAVIKVIPINDRGEVMLEEYEKLLSPRTRIVAITHVSNVLGTINPVHSMIELAHRHGALVLIDGAQAVPHTRVNVRELDADFYAFSGHKVYGPTGIGVLYGKKALLEAMPPWQRGGGMIRDVSFSETTFNGLPNKFEAGTGNIADAIGLGAAIDYVQKIGMENIERHEKELTDHAMEALYQVPGLHMIGTAPNKTSVLSFIIDGISPDKVAAYLNQEGIAVRAGHHCAQPALRRYGLSSSIRASLGLYNTLDEVNLFVQSVLRMAKSYH